MTISVPKWGIVSLGPSVIFAVTLAIPKSSMSGGALPALLLCFGAAAVAGIVASIVSLRRSERPNGIALLGIAANAALLLILCGTFLFIGTPA